MTISETEKLIVHAERMFRSFKEKLTYVNSKLGVRFLPDATIDPRDKRMSIGKSSYYRKLGTIKNRHTEFLFELALKFEEETIEDYLELLEIKQMKYDTYWKIKGEGKDYYADQILNSIIAMQPYISNQREALSMVKKYEHEAIEQASKTPPDSIFEKRS